LETLVGNRFGALDHKVVGRAKARRANVANRTELLQARPAGK